MSVYIGALPDQQISDHLMKNGLHVQHQQMAVTAVVVSDIRFVQLQRMLWPALVPEVLNLSSPGMEANPEP